MADEPQSRAARRTGPSRAAIVAHTTVRMPQPASHNFEVEIELTGLHGDVTLAFPAWTPGSYKVRDFAKNVSAFKARDARSDLEIEILDKQRFRIHGARDGATVTFTLYADEFSVRTPHLDDQHGFFLGTNLLPYIEREEGLPARARYEISIEPPKDWNVATGLQPVKGQKNTWFADDYDILGDSIFEIGTHEVHSFKAFGVKHDVAYVGWGNWDKKKITADIKKLCETEPKLFGGVPYEYYLFVIHSYPDAGGGLEHLNSCVCAWDSFKYRKKDDYENFLRLVAHEYFHVWNVKRIRPEILGPFNYSREQHTKALWVMEGLTQYYEKLWCARAGIISDETLLAAYAEIIEKEDARPGRRVMSLEESSWLAWTKLYQADENFVNSAVSYYSRGAQAGFALDAKIRAHTKGDKSLDDVMKLAMDRYGWPKPGFAERGFESLCEEVAGADLSAFWRDYTQGTKDHDYSEAMNVYGLEFKREKDEKEQWLGATVAMKDALFQVRSVEAGSPASKAGLQVRDEVLALNGHKVTSKDFEERLKDFKPGSRARLSLFRRGKLIETEIEVGSKPASKLKLTRVKKPSAQQEKNFKRWLWR